MCKTFHLAGHIFGVPSAGGARAPLSRQVSHLVTSVGPWAVTFWRNRCFAYYRYEERELFRSYFRLGLITGLILNWDLTPMRVWVNNSDLRSREVALTVIRSVDSQGHVCNILSPKMSRPKSSKAAGILGSVFRYNTHVDELLDSPGVKFYIMNSDSCPTNCATV